MSEGWNHNTHYHDIVLDSVPPNCRRALDVGCGEGLLARRLVQRCEEVLALDLDAAVLVRAAANSAEPRIAFRQGDVMTDDLAREGFDFISVVAALHHLPLRPALERFRELLKPGGCLAIVGLYRAETPIDYAIALAAFPASSLMRAINGYAEVEAPLAEPTETLRDIRAACDAVLPGAILHRRLFFRFTLLWRKQATPPLPSPQAAIGTR